MPQVKYRVKAAGSYGKRGDIVSLNTAELTDRQKVMLEPYTEPEVNVIGGNDDSDKDDGKMTKDQISAKLKELGIEFNPADKKEVLAALLPKA